MATFLLTACLLLLAVPVIDCLTHSEDNILYFFPEAQRDGLNIEWAHDLNSNVLLGAALEGTAMMLEADVSLRGKGTPDQVPIMAPTSVSFSDITLEQWIDKVTRYTNKGIKLDFKDVQAVQPSLDILTLKKAQLRVPLFFHADIVAGPNGQNSIDLIQPTEFIAIVNAMFPNATFSLGFVSETTGISRQDRYTWSMVFDMLDASASVTTHPITFNFRALWSIKSWEKFIWVTGLTTRYSITVWSKATDILNDFKGLVALRQNGDQRRIFYDLPPAQLQAFKNDLSFVSPTTSAPKAWNRALWQGNSDGFAGNYIYLSEAGAAVVGDSYPGFIQTIDMWKTSKDGNTRLIVKGRIQFVQRSIQKPPGPVITEIIIRASPMKVTDVVVPIVGIKCAIMDDGRIYVQDLSSHFDSVEKMIPSSQCYSFEVIDSGQQISFTVEVVQCSDADLAPNYVGRRDTVTFNNVTNTDTGDFFVQITKSGDVKNIVVEDLSITGVKFTKPSKKGQPNSAVESRGSTFMFVLSILSIAILKSFT